MNLKKALKHDVEVAGKTIPTMILVGLFLVGGGSAALLSSFGTVSGEADVQQAVDVDGPTTVSYSDGTLTAGTTTVDTFTVSSNNGETAVDYTLNLQREATDSEGNTGTMTGVTTTVYDVNKETKTLDASKDSGSGTGEVTETYNAAEGKTVFTVDEGDIADSFGGAVRVDSDQDEEYDFQVDYLRNDAEGTDDIGYWEKDNEGWTLVKEWDGEHHEVNSDQYGFYANLKSDGTFVVEFDDSKTTQSFDYRAHVSWEETPTDDTRDKVETATTGTVSPVVVEGDGSTSQTVEDNGDRNYALVNEWAINLDPSYDYNVTAAVEADYDQEGQQNPEN